MFIVQQYHFATTLLPMSIKLTDHVSYSQNNFHT